jgi:hypothetical protein
MTIADTSREAAARIAPHAESLRERVFSYIKSRGIHGATIDEVAEALHIRTASVCGRFSELQGKDYGEDGQAKRWPKRIEKSDEKRKSSSGFSCQVWVALP